ncbi:hypothetical protein DPEC_G00304860 [Dallia pectoralis]|uniref:Uncharacterized protein n=1 Tax=Dallia pectoralis TaxID=75939 RepID=A0ACC2FDH5_DALPE|nr:hypothetical protein DPEC_G00304860 [Dallia pectoralis]
MALQKLIFRVIISPRPFVNISKKHGCAFSVLHSDLNMQVEHDRTNSCFFIRLVVEGKLDKAVLRYKFTGKNGIDLLSTDVPESFRGKGVAALLSKEVWLGLITSKRSFRDSSRNFSLFSSLWWFVRAPVAQINHVGRGCATSRRLPQGIIIGVKKGGTRALLEFLRLHPDIRALGSEPHFFDRHYSRGLNWYRSLMPKALEGQVVLEKTPRYYVTVESPNRIHTMSREVKLIVVVRDPVTRAISDYTQILSKSPSVPTFETLAFRNGTEEKFEVDTLWSPISIGLYALHLERWLAYFPIEQIHFFHGERLVSNPAGELGRVQDFLGLQKIITDKHFYFNMTKGFPCLKKPEGSSKPHCLGKTKGRPHVDIHPQVIRRLKLFYQPHNLRFYHMTGQDFGWLRNPEFSPPPTGTAVMYISHICSVKSSSNCFCLIRSFFSMFRRLYLNSRMVLVYLFSAVTAEPMQVAKEPHARLEGRGNGQREKKMPVWNFLMRNFSSPDSQMYWTSRLSFMLLLLKRMQYVCLVVTGPVQKGLTTFLVPSHQKLVVTADRAHANATSTVFRLRHCTANLHNLVAFSGQAEHQWWMGTSDPVRFHVGYYSI